MDMCEICGEESSEVESVTVAINYYYGPIMVTRCRKEECRSELPILPAMAVLREM